jgi:hypothetical protein
MYTRALPALLRWLLVAALLAAQQAAFSHQIWHLGRAAAALGPDSAADHQQPAKSTLCEFHDSLGTVLGALSCALPNLASERSPEPGFAATPVRAPCAASPKPSSRDPPSLA